MTFLSHPKVVNNVEVKPFWAVICMAPYLTLIYRATGLELLSSIAGEKPTEEKGIAKRNLKVAILILNFKLKYETLT